MAYRADDLEQPSWSKIRAFILDFYGADHDAQNPRLVQSVNGLRHMMSWKEDTRPLLWKVATHWRFQDKEYGRLDHREGKQAFLSLLEIKDPEVIALIQSRQQDLSIVMPYHHATIYEELLPAMMEADPVSFEPIVGRYIQQSAPDTLWSKPVVYASWVARSQSKEWLEAWFDTRMLRTTSSCQALLQHIWLLHLLGEEGWQDRLTAVSARPECKEMSQHETWVTYITQAAATLDSTYHEPVTWSDDYASQIKDTLSYFKDFPDRKIRVLVDRLTTKE